jgi:hypothetical protein
MFAVSVNAQMVLCNHLGDDGVENFLTMSLRDDNDVSGSLHVFRHARVAKNDRLSQRPDDERFKRFAITAQLVFIVVDQLDDGVLFDDKREPMIAVRFFQVPVGLTRLSTMFRTPFDYVSNADFQSKRSFQYVHVFLSQS